MSINADLQKYISTSGAKIVSSNDFGLNLNGSQIFNIAQPIGTSYSDVTELRRELIEAKQQLSESQKQINALQQSLVSGVNKQQIEQLQAQVQDLSDSLEQTQSSLSKAQERSNDLNAPVIVPDSTDMTIRLVPTHWLDRLEEYRSDESVATLLIGLFGGGLIGIVGSWFTTIQTSVTTAANNQAINPTATSLISNPSGVAFSILLVLLTRASSYWMYRIRKRSDSVRAKMFSFNVATSEVNNIK